MVQFLDPETTEILPFLDPEIVKMDKKYSGSRNCRNGAISESRNRRKGRQILYRLKSYCSSAPNSNLQKFRYLQNNLILPVKKESYMTKQ